MSTNYTREQIADLIARKSIESGSYGGQLNQFQKTIDSDKNSPTYGKIVTGRLTTEQMLIFRSDYYANPEDQPKIDDGFITGSMGADGAWPGDWDPFGDGGSDPHNLWQPPNVGQFVEFESGSVSINPTLFKELVDTTISELIPTIANRQQRINNFFDEYFELRGDIPPYINQETGEIDLESNDYQTYLTNNSISYMQDSGLDDSQANLTRLTSEENEANTEKTLEFLYRDIQDRLKDIQFANDSVVEDDRDEYEDEGDGYMEIQNLNDALLINNAADENQSGDTGIADEDDDCVGLDETACLDPTDNLDCEWDGANCYTGTGV